jgi:hypothetical protein
MLRPQNILYVVARPHSPQRDTGCSYHGARIAHRFIKEGFALSPYQALE